MKRAPLLLALAVCVAITVAAFSRVTVSTDMAAFLPAGRTAASRFMLRELQSGSVASLILLGIEGAPPQELARISTAMADQLDRTGLFAAVANGRQGLDGPEGRLLFADRYLLSPGVDAAAFTTDALRADLQRLLLQLQSSASPLAVQFGLPDPVGAFAAMAPAWIGTARLRSVGGVWFAADRDRALLLATTRAGGMDIAAQDTADAAIRQAFAAANPGSARLLASGPAEFARAAAASIRSDIRLLSIVSGVLVTALLLWRFRSLTVLAAIAVPVTLSVAAAALAVQAAYGFVHGIALGFGMTMLGVTVDYPVLLIGHRKFGEPAGGTLRRIGPAFALAVLCASLGLSGMAFAGFPGISQLGLFALAGVVAAALATVLLLPPLIVRANLAPVSAGDPARTLRVEALRRYRAWGLLPVALAAAGLLAMGGPHWEGDIANLSPVPQAARDLDAALRQEIGAPDLGPVLVIEGATAEVVLARQEAALARLGPAKVEAAARLLSSAAVQRQRQADLPDAATLHDRLAAASAGLPFRPDAFDAFASAVAAARGASPVTLADLGDGALAARIRPLLFERAGRWYGPIAGLSPQDPARLQALAGQDALFLDMHAETNAIVASGAERAGWWLAGGAVAAVAALLAGLRSVRMVGRIVLAIGAAVLVTVACLTALGQRLSLIHLVALQLTVGVGIDYALFYARRKLDAEERARTLRTLVTCNVMTLLTFGLLATCQTPLLQAIGLTVAIGAVAAMGFSFLFVGWRPPAVRPS